MLSIADFDGFWETTEQLWGWSNLEYDYISGAPLPEVLLYADGVEEITANYDVLYLDGGHYLYIWQLTAAQRMMLYHSTFQMRMACLWWLLQLTHSIVTLTSGITEYKRLGSQIGQIGEPVQFVYAAAFLL